MIPAGPTHRVVCWLDMGVTDLDGIASVYARLLGWTAAAPSSRGHHHPRMADRPRRSVSAKPRRGRVGRLARVLAAAALVTSGCGEAGHDSTVPRPDSMTSGTVAGPSEDATIFTQNPCSLLTSDEVAHALGAASVSVVPTVTVPGGYRQCAWSVPGGRGSLVLAYLPEAGTESLRTLLGGAGSTIGIKRLDIGDGAARLPAGLEVLVGHGGFQLVAVPTGVEMPLATLVAARLR